MKKSRMLIAASLLGVVLVIFTGCDRSSEASASTTADQSQTNQRSNSTDETSNSSNDRSATENEDQEQDGLKSDLPDDNAQADSNDHAENELPAASLKEEYLKKLNDTTKETEKMKAQDPSTYAMKNVENEKWQIWDDLLNEIYGVLEKQLPQEEMTQLREEQREWIDYRDKAALDASQKYKGGTQEHLEYVTVLATLTEKRCYELVSNYMQ